MMSLLSVFEFNLPSAGEYYGKKIECENSN